MIRTGAIFISVVWLVTGCATFPTLPKEQPEFQALMEQWVPPGTTLEAADALFTDKGFEKERYKATFWRTKQDGTLSVFKIYYENFACGRHYWVTLRFAERRVTEVTTHVSVKCW